MSAYDTVKKDYGANAAFYEKFQKTPYGKLEFQLFASALGDAAGQTVLDLGGGTGIKARQALDAGAASVDVVDISAEMMEVGKDIEAQLGRHKINWYEADASKPLDHLNLGQYDIVMANWLFDHATNEDALEGMWQNVSTYLSPGGRFVGVRSGDPRSPSMSAERYGCTYNDIEDIPGGVRLRYTLHLDPPVEFEATMMAASYSGSTKMHEKFGLEDIQIEPFDNIPCLREDPEFWKLYLEHPCMTAVKAKKKLA